ncbi:sulfatase [Fretibacter rubidus]|uniref:sulfatase family protein n=1 Tax=Fretibacter rubidus TaxID=570162 RepID=UPI00352A3A85
MKRFVLPAVILMMLILCSCSKPQSVTQSEAPLERPNIFLIRIEDLSPKFGSFGDPLAHTPNIDALAARGTKFTNVFTTAGVCSPSRSALITGVHQQTMGTMQMRTSSFGANMLYGAPYEAVPPSHIKAFPELLRARGYYALNNVKTDYQFGNPFTVWDESSKTADWKNAPTDKPLFAMLNFIQTHESFAFPTDTVIEGNRYAKHFVPRNKKFDEGKSVFTDPADVIVPPYYPDTPQVRENLARYYDNLARTDEMIGALIADIEASERGKNAVIILTTDHGDGLARAKRTLYDSGLKVPTIIAYSDNRGAGTVRDDLVSFVDIAPTLLNFAGANIPDYIQGRIFEGPNRGAERDYIYAAADRLDEREQRFKAIRSHDFKYIRNYTPDKPRLPSIEYQNNSPVMKQMRAMLGEGTLSPVSAQYFQTPSPEAELYKLSSDPHEIDNLAYQQAYQGQLETLSAAMDDWISVTGDMSAVPELEMVAKMWPGGKQPVTKPPTACLANGNVQWTSKSDGASIGFANTQNAAAWNIYARPYTAAGITHAKAVRYGYAESEVTSAALSELKTCP